ncbi:MAG: AraC family transcriptional regulator, partial [Campylobacterales bacterium]|nr:AraC family transcriptional regulator [Campylobacterales bacterium]
LCIMASIDGTINNFDQNSNINTVLNQNEIATVYSKEVSGSEFYKKGEKYRSINILLSDNFIQKYLSEDRNIFKNFNKTNYYKILNKKRMDLKNQMCINSLFQTSMEESLERIKLQSLILEITHSEILDLTNLKEEKKSSQIKFSDFDKEALHKAKEILSNNFKNPPSINQLSKLVHLNEFKLKYGFKFFFNTTPYGIVADMRMEKAKELLEKSYLNINEISLEVGFKHSTNFSKAFFNKYKVLPKDVVKTRSYYY